MYSKGAGLIKQPCTSHPFKVWEQTKDIASPNSLIIRFTRCNYLFVGAILREISGGTSYQMVRLVFRPYTQVWRSICTSEPLRASIRVSPDFTLLRHSSPSFGSQRMCSYSNLLPKLRIGRWCILDEFPPRLVSLRLWVYFPKTHTCVALLGPCFKTGWFWAFRSGLEEATQWYMLLSYLNLAQAGQRRDAFNGPLSSTFAQDEIHRTGLWNCKSPFFQRRPTDPNHTAQKRLPFKQFQVLLTPSSGFFSSFPHGTCSLSVSRPYLALDGTYHPLRAAIPNNSTLWSSCVQQSYYKSTRLSLSMARAFHNTWLNHIAAKHHQTTILAFREILMMSFSLFTRSY